VAPARRAGLVNLRPYQHAAVDAVYAHLRSRDDNPCVVIPTGAGKTHVLATICRDAVQQWSGRVVVIAHVKELLEQAVDKLAALAPDLPVGVYSAGLRRRELDCPVTVAGIQSVYQKAGDLGPVDLAIIDECHLIPPDGEGMYRHFLGQLRTINPQVRIIGLTATPFRMKSGLICGPENVLNQVCYEIGVRELIVQGYLCPLRSKAGTPRPDYDQLHVRGGEYVAGETEALMNDADLVHAACSEIVSHTQDRHSVLIFAAGVQHARHIADVLRQRHDTECGFVCGATPLPERAALLDRFRSGALKYLCNVNVLTTGFDAPNIDCIALVRPTLSPGLFVQMAGRGFRLHPDKTDCLVLDFGGNVLRHGPVDQLRVTSSCSQTRSEAPAKECEQCQALVAAGYASCPECGHAFPPPQRGQHDAMAGTEAILSDEVTRSEHDVTDVFYAVHTKRDAPEDAPRTMRVDYRLGFQTYAAEWVCFEHTGYARHKAEVWWRTRSSEPVPASAEEAVALADAGALAETRRITVERRPKERFDRVVGYALGPRPPRLESDKDLPQHEPAWDPSEVPF
jgi:DNA repair protein RadD